MGTVDTALKSFDLVIFLNRPVLQNLPKLDQLKPQIEFYNKMWSCTQHFIFKNYKVQGFQHRVNSPHSHPGAKVKAYVKKVRLQAPTAIKNGER